MSAEMPPAMPTEQAYLAVVDRMIDLEQDCKRLEARLAACRADRDALGERWRACRAEVEELRAWLGRKLEDERVLLESAGVVVAERDAAQALLGLLRGEITEAIACLDRPAPYAAMALGHLRHALDAAGRAPGETGEQADA